MVFRKNIEPRCGYCKFGAPAHEDHVICRKKGIKPETSHCRAFRYDPLKRVPPKHLNMDFSSYDEKDYSL